MPDRLAVIARYSENTSWLQRAPIPYAVVDKSWIPNVGGDATSYLAWILLNYHSLPKWLLFLRVLLPPHPATPGSHSASPRTHRPRYAYGAKERDSQFQASAVTQSCAHAVLPCAFVDAHEYHWHHAKYSQLRSMLIDVERAGRGFLSVNHNEHGNIIWFSKDLLAELSNEEHAQLRRDLLGLHTPYSGKVRHAPCGQFWVRRDRILARPLSFYRRLYDALSDPQHSLLGRYAAAEGYPSRQLHVFFIEGYWHYVFGEPESYRLPYKTYDRIPLLPLGEHGWEPAPLEPKAPRRSFPPLRLTLRGLTTHLLKERGRPTPPAITLANASGSAFDALRASSLSKLSTGHLVSRMTRGCDCASRHHGRAPELCRRAADAAVLLILRIAGTVDPASDVCEGSNGGLAVGLAQLLTASPFGADAERRVRALQSTCFGGTGGARDYALTAFVACLNTLRARHSR